MSCIWLYFAINLFSFFILFHEVALESRKSDNDFLLITVATNETDGYKRFIRSAKVYGIPVEVIGMGVKWEGGDMNGPGGGHKISLFKEALEPFKDEKNKIIMFTDCYDVVVTGSLVDIIHRFENMDANIVFSAEHYCWPDSSLADDYPATESKYKYLNSGGFIGYASDIYSFISAGDVESSKTDDQLFYTKLFLDKKLREKHRVKLDYKANIFQNLFGVTDDIELRFDDNLSYLENTKYNTIPLVIHGNGKSKESLNSLSNYVPNVWTMAEGCVTCNEDRLTLPQDEKDYPVVFIGVFITHPTPYLEEFFRRVHALQYPKEKIHLFIYNSVPYHISIVKKFITSYSKEYSSFKQIHPTDEIGEADARNHAIGLFEKKKCDYYFNVDSVAHFDNPKVIQLLMESNKRIIAPLLLRPFKAWSNFWGALTKDGYYHRSLDYMNIVNYERKGLWNVPYITSVYLIKSSLIKELRPKYHHDSLDPDMSFCKNYRDQGVFMYIDNMVEYGHLVDPEQYDIKKVNPDLYEIFTNRYDWEQRYIHPDYYENLNPNKTIKQPCQDVYWFPIVSERFCKELIEIMENFGKWSDGSNQDNRLIGGYENVPTRDIHMNQIGFELGWMEFLRVYVRPIQELLFVGYFHDPPRSLMNFVIRYKPDEQPSLRPHHDSSTYTVNLALNKPTIDYKGGGCKFIRYNCSVVDTKVGWMMMHPGRLTHYHEGLEVTEGTRYIAISFVDP